MSEDAAVQQLSQLGCSLRLEAAPAAGPAAGSAGAGEGAGAGAAAEGVCTGAAADAAPEGAPPAPPQQEQQPQQETQPQPVGGSGSAWVPAPAGALDFPVGGFYAQVRGAGSLPSRQRASRPTTACRGSAGAAHCCLPLRLPRKLPTIWITRARFHVSAASKQPAAPPCHRNCEYPVRRVSIVHYVPQLPRSTCSRSRTACAASSPVPPAPAQPPSPAQECQPSQPS